MKESGAADPLRLTGRGESGRGVRAARARPPRRGRAKRIGRRCKRMTRGRREPHEPGRSQAMRMVARRTGAIVVVGILAVTVGRGWPAMAQGRGNILTLALHFYPSTLDPAIGVAGPPHPPCVCTHEGGLRYARRAATIAPSLSAST